MPKYALQERAKWAGAQDGGILFDFLLTTACKTCFHPLNAGDLCPDCQRFVNDEMSRQAEIAGRWLNDVLSGGSCRYTHVFGVGYVDGWSREGRQYLDD